MLCTEVVLDQLYQLMAFKAPSDHVFQNFKSVFQNFGHPPKLKKDIQYKNTRFISFFVTGIRNGQKMAKAYNFTIMMAVC